MYTKYNIILIYIRIIVSIPKYKYPYHIISMNVFMSYKSMYTKYNYTSMSMIEILYSFMSVYTNLPRYKPLPVL